MIIVLLLVKCVRVVTLGDLILKYFYHLFSLSLFSGWLGKVLNCLPQEDLFRYS